MEAKQLQPSEVQAINILLDAMNPFFQMSVRNVQTFLLVAQNEGAPVQEYARRARITAATMSRNLLDIGERNRKGQPGYGLVSGREALDRRLKEYFLTEKGRGLVRKIGKNFAQKGSD